MLVLLSPAKSLDTSPLALDLELTEPRFGDDTTELMARCKQLSAPDLRGLMRISESLATLNQQRFQEMGMPHTSANAKPALLTFQGDVYKELDVSSLREADLQYAQDHVRILSGLYGLLRPMDLIQPYRLEMGTKLETARGANLYEFWGDRLVASLNAEPTDMVLNLASKEYFKAVPPANLKKPLITAVFHEMRDGQPKTIGLLAKRARGMMTRWIVRNRIDDPEHLVGFSEGGYQFSDELSGERHLVFVRSSQA